MENKLEPIKKIDRNDKGPTFGIRYVQFVFLFFVAFLVYATRHSFSVALVAMTQNYSLNPEIPYYNWTNKNFILSTFFWGYVLPQIPVGILGTKFGSKNFLLIAVCVDSVCMISIPMVAAHFGSEGVMVCRIIQGFAQGFVVPSAHGLIGKWALPSERAKAYGCLSSGYTVGMVWGLSSTGFICDSWAGWPLTFYLMPALSFVWVSLYFFYGAASPGSHKTITDAEKIYIQATIKSTDVYNVHIPYRAMFTSNPFLALMFMALCSGWGFCIFTTEMPIYMDKVMKFNIVSNGLVSSLPHAFTLISVNIATFTADYLIKKNYLSVGNTRKLMSFVGSTGCAILLLVFIWIPVDSKTLCVVLFVAAFGFRSVNGGGFSINHLDLAPNLAAALMGFVNTSAEMFSFITPLIIQYIVYNESDRNLWRIVFITAFCLYVFSTCIYLKFASGEVQPWNDVHAANQDKICGVQEKPEEEQTFLT